jgi:hypothetical protein
MVDAAAYAFRLPEVYATACATCYLPLDEIRITDGWRRQRVAAPRGSNSLHHRACVLGVPASPYSDCPERDASYEYDPDLACVCGKAVTRETARMDRTCIVVAHQNRRPGDGGAGQPRIRLYHERCVAHVITDLVRGGAPIENLAALAFVHTAGSETRLFESAMHVLAPGYSLQGVPIFAWAKSEGSPELDGDKGERSALARTYLEAAMRLPSELIGRGAQRIAREAERGNSPLLCDDGDSVYVECKHDYGNPVPGVYPFVTSRSGPTGGTVRGSGVSVGLIRLADGTVLFPDRWVKLVDEMHKTECKPSRGARRSQPGPKNKARK